MMGSSESHYTASKLYPGLLARRPILAIYHHDSSVVQVLRRVAKHPTVRLVTYDGVRRAESRIEGIYSELGALMENPVYDMADVDMEGMQEYSANVLARRLAGVFARVRKAC
jgi:hypothetical protein